jgi:transcriptional regulator with XRE-family HTH domain
VVNIGYDERLKQLGHEIHMRRKTLRLSLRDVAARTELSAAYVGTLEGAARSERPSRPSPRVIEKLAAELGGDRLQWLELAGHISSRDAPADEDRRDLPVLKPEGLANLERIETDLEKYLSPHRRLWAEVPALAALKHCDGKKDIAIIGISARLSDPTALLCRLRPALSLPYEHLPSDEQLAGLLREEVAIGTFGLYTEATMFLILYLQRGPFRGTGRMDEPADEPGPFGRGRGLWQDDPIPYRLWSYDRTDKPVIESGDSPDTNNRKCDIFVAYSAGALVDRLRLSKIGAYGNQKFEFVSIVAQPYIARKEEWEWCEPITTLDDVLDRPYRRLMPSTVVVSRKSSLQDPALNARIRIEIDALERTNAQLIEKDRASSSILALPRTPEQMVWVQNAMVEANRLSAIANLARRAGLRLDGASADVLAEHVIGREVVFQSGRE